MTNDEIAKLAREYVADVYGGDTDFIDEAENVISWLLRTHCIVSKDKEKEAEGEEMLTVSRKQVQNLYNYHKSRGHHLAGESLIKLFGAKCLPDLREQKPTQPKFKVGDKVRVITHQGEVTLLEGEICEIIDIDKYDPICTYYLHNFSGEWYSDSDLEPYTEPEEACNDQISNN